MWPKCGDWFPFWCACLNRSQLLTLALGRRGRRNTNSFFICSSPDSATVTQPPVSPSVLSKTPKKIPAVWKGFVMMQSVAKFGTSAYRVSGSCDDLLQLLPDTLHVQGRIAHEQVWDYLLQLKSSTSRVWISIFSIPDSHTSLVVMVLRTWIYIYMTIATAHL